MNKPLKMKKIFIATLLSGLSSVALANEPSVVTTETASPVTNNYAECWKANYDNTQLLQKMSDADKEKCGYTVQHEEVRIVPQPAYKPVVVTKKHTFKQETLFDFDKAALKEGGKKTISDMLQQASEGNSQIKQIVVVGHTDAMGSEQYNQKLSEKRANTVANYISQLGFSPTIIQAVGMGEQEASTEKECMKNKKRAERIACMSPDRKVDINVTSVSNTVR